MAGIEGQSILVTGGGSGIGLATAQRLAADGAQVTICGRTEQKLVDATAVIGSRAVSTRCARQPTRSAPATSWPTSPSRSR